MSIKRRLARLVPDVTFMFAWYDLWVGVFIDRRKRKVYVMFLPCIGFLLDWS